jgi:protein TonB
VLRAPNAPLVAAGRAGGAAGAPLPIRLLALPEPATEAPPVPVPHAAPPPPRRRPARAAAAASRAPEPRPAEPSAALADAGAIAGGAAAPQAGTGEAPEAAAVGVDAATVHAEGDVDRAAAPADPIRPVYPSRARWLGAEADVVVSLVVDARGEVGAAEVVGSGGEEFDTSALAAVRAARFAPALRDGRAVASRLTLRLHFRLD